MVARTGRRKGIIVAVVVGVLALLAGGLVVLDGFARQQVASTVTEKVQSVLGLESADTIDVEVGGTSVLQQLVTGRLDRLDVDVDDVAVGDLTGNLSVVATGVPTDTAKTVDRVRADFTVDEAGIQSIAGALSDTALTGTALTDVVIADGEVQFGTGIDLFGFSLDLTIGVVPSVSSGQIAFAPSSIELNGARVEADELRKRFGTVADALLQARTVCIADRLPESIVLTGAEISGNTLVASFDARDVPLEESALATLGTCS